MSLLSGFRLVQLGPGRAAAVCGRLFADSGASVATFGARSDSVADAHFNGGKTPIAEAGLPSALATANLIVAEGGPAVLAARGWCGVGLRAAAPNAALVLISPYGQTGPWADAPATDLTLFYASGIARLLTGQVDDLSEPPIHAIAEQSAIIGGAAAACAGMHAALLDGHPATADVSIHEAYQYLSREVPRRTAGNQHPVLRGEFSGQVFLGGIQERSKRGEKNRH